MPTGCPKQVGYRGRTSNTTTTVTLTLRMTKLPIIFCPSGILLEEDGGRPKFRFRAAGRCLRVLVADFEARLASNRKALRSCEPKAAQALNPSPMNRRSLRPGRSTVVSNPTPPTYRRIVACSDKKPQCRERHPVWLSTKLQSPQAHT